MKKINKAFLLLASFSSIVCAKEVSEQAPVVASMTAAGIVMPKIDKKKKIKELEGRIKKLETQIDSTTVNAHKNKERLRRERDMLKRQLDILKNSNK